MLMTVGNFEVRVNRRCGFTAEGIPCSPDARRIERALDQAKNSALELLVLGR